MRERHELRRPQDQHARRGQHPGHTQRCCLLDGASRKSAQANIVAGWWRASEYSNTFYRCEYSGACKQGRCTEGHKGPACRVCEKGYAYDALENKCTECSGEILYSLLGFLGVALALVLVGAAVVRKYPKLFEMVAKDAARGTVEQDEDEENKDASHKWLRLAKSKFKIVLGVYRTVSRKFYSIGLSNGLPSTRAQAAASHGQL